MYKIIAHLKSSSPLSFSKYYNVPKKDQESPAIYEQRTWRERLHYDASGEVLIPPMAFKKCIENAASYLSVKIEGKRNQTYTKKFKAATICSEKVMLGINKEDVESEILFVPSDGKPGGGTRVEKTFPLIHEWQGVVVFYVLDNTITPEVFEYHLREAGKFIGIGRFRPINGGFYGRFNVEKIETQEMDNELEAA